MGDSNQHQDIRIPVTILTGFLGAGKSTLLDYVLSSKSHGYRIAVINNEYASAQDFPHRILNSSKKDSKNATPNLNMNIFETNSGCICCSGGQSDLRNILHELMHQEGKFDYVLIETTGLADPSFASMFMMDPLIHGHFYIDGIVTVVDAKYALDNIKAPETDDLGVRILNEAVEQIGVADRILINKIDTVPSSSLEDIERHLMALNPTATVFRTEYSRVTDLADVLGIHSFDDSKIKFRMPGAITHDPRLGTVALRGTGKIPLKAFSTWLQRCLDDHSRSILRTKAVVQVSGEGVNQTYLFQGVRDMLDSTPMVTDVKQPSPHPKAPLDTRILFIGKKLDARELCDSYYLCMQQIGHAGPDTTSAIAPVQLKKQLPPEWLRLTVHDRTATMQMRIMIRVIVAAFILALLYMIK